MTRQRQHPISRVKFWKKYILLFCAVLSCMALSSCFDLVEQVDMKTDGSGAIKATLNMSKSRSKVASLMKLKSVNGINIPSEATIKKEMETAVKLLRNTTGISNVQYNLDFNNYIATISCDFQSINALNDFTKTLSKQFNSQITSYNSYEFNNNTQSFKRNYTYMPSIGKEFSKLSAEDRKIFDEAYYTNIVRFNSPVKSSSHQEAKIASNRKAVLLKVKATDLITGKANLSNQITLTK